MLFFQLIHTVEGQTIVNLKLHNFRFIHIGIGHFVFNMIMQVIMAEFIQILRLILSPQ